MFRSVVVGADGHAGDHDAMALARRLAPGGRWMVVTLRGPGSAALLQETASELRPDLVVIGSPHRGRLRRLVLGPAGVRASPATVCPVALAPCGYARRDADVREVVAGFDGSEASAVAVRHAEALAGDLAARLLVVGVASGQSALGHLQELLDRLPLRGSADCRTAVGDPADELARIADRDGVLLVGSGSEHARSWALLGSTADRLAQRPRCPLLVVPPWAAVGRGVPAARASAGG